MATKVEPEHTKEFDQKNMLITIAGEPPGLLTNAIPQGIEVDIATGGDAGRQPKAKAKPSIAEQFDGSLYHLPEPFGEFKYGIKGDAFKQAMVRAAITFKKLGATTFKRLDGTQVRSLIWVCHSPDELVPVLGEPEPRTDLIGNSAGSKTAVTRAWFREWSSVVPVGFFHALIHEEQVEQLMSDAGQGIGVGAWRRERGGHFGLWKIVGWEWE